MRESRIQKKITDWLTSQNIWWMKAHQTSFSRSGAPDLIACTQGRFLAMEVKTPTGTPTLLQIREREKILKSGGTCEIVRSLEDVKKLVKEMQNGP